MMEKRDSAAGLAFMNSADETDANWMAQLMNDTVVAALKSFGLRIYFRFRLGVDSRPVSTKRSGIWNFFVWMFEAERWTEKKVGPVIGNPKMSDRKSNPSFNSTLWFRGSEAVGLASTFFKTPRGEYWRIRLVGTDSEGIQPTAREFQLYLQKHGATGDHLIVNHP